MQCAPPPRVSSRPATREGDIATDAGALQVLTFLHAPGPGGVERIALRLIAGWQRAGTTVHLVLGDPDGPMADDRIAGSVVAVPFRWPARVLNWRTLAMLRACLRAVRTRRPDIIFCPGNSYTIIAVLLKIRLGQHCPPILAKISNDLIRADMPVPLRACYTMWLRIQGRAIDHFAVLSEPMARETVTRLRIDPARVHVVPNPVLSLADIDRCAQLPRTASHGDGRRFVAVGRLEPQKNYPLMLRAFAAASRPEDRLTIYGEGRERAALEALARRLGIATRVHFAGFRADILMRLSDHDVLLLSSRYEGQPGAVVEALARGIAIIATRCCGSMAPLLDDGALGALVPRDDEQAFAQAIRTARPNRMDSRRAREKAAAFTLERAVPAYDRLFRHILNGAPEEQRRPAHPLARNPLEAQPS